MVAGQLPRGKAAGPSLEKQWNFETRHGAFIPRLSNKWSILIRRVQICPDSVVRKLLHNTFDILRHQNPSFHNKIFVFSANDPRFTL